MYERAIQYERWKRRRLPENVEQKVGVRPDNKLARYTGRVFALSLLICLFLPYPYEPGGAFVILPTEQQQVASDIGGIVTEVLVEGGEQVKAGQVLARLATGDLAAQVKIAEARIAEEQAIVAELKARPRAEEVDVARRSLDMARTQTQFSLTNHQRHITLLAKGGVSAQQADQARRQYEVDLMAVKVAEANLALVSSGATPDSIAAAEAQVQRWQSERNLYQAKIERSQLRAPMDGKLIPCCSSRRSASSSRRANPSPWWRRPSGCSPRSRCRRPRSATCSRARYSRSSRWPTRTGCSTAP